MQRLTKIIFAILIVTLVIPSVADAKRKRKGYGGEMPYTFTKSKVLPGGIGVEYSLVTLKKYKKDVDKVFDYTFSETERIAQLFHTSYPGSDLAKVAAAAGTKQPVMVSKETLVLADHAKEIAKWTGGAFDPVIGATYKTLKINKKKNTLYLKKAGSSLNLRGILEGFIADLFIRAAYHANLDDAFVVVGGAKRSMGQTPYGPWRVMLIGDGKGNARHGMSVSLVNYSVATVGGKYYTPSVDPRNGKPVNTNFSSVTVLTEQAATAQAIASSIYVLGEDFGKSLVEDLGIRAIFAYNDGTFKKIGVW